jgi:prepilin-type N-terminal cleavage/methylation domain-containing protein
MRNEEGTDREEAKSLIPNSKFRIPHSKGFTLIELLAILVVLGIMMAIVIPTFGELTGANLRRSTRHITSLVRLLRDEAEAKKTVYRLRFDVPNGEYWAEKLTPLSDQTVEFKRASSVISMEGSLSGSTTFRNIVVTSHPDDPWIQFTPDGWVEKAFIHLRDGEGRDYTLIVKPLTGDTELREGDVEEQ